MQTFSSIVLDSENTRQVIKVTRMLKLRMLKNCERKHNLKLFCDYCPIKVFILCLYECIFSLNRIDLVKQI